jgi:hypothetical protein
MNLATKGINFNGYKNRKATAVYLPTPRQPWPCIARVRIAAISGRVYSGGGA